MRFTYLKIEPSREPRGNARVSGSGVVMSRKSITELTALNGHVDIQQSRNSILVEAKPKLSNFLSRITRGPKPHGSNGWIVISGPSIFDFSHDVPTFHQQEIDQGRVGQPFYYQVLGIFNRYSSIPSLLGGENRQIFKVSYEGSKFEYSIDEEPINDVFEEL